MHLNQLEKETTAFPTFEIRDLGAMFMTKEGPRKQFSTANFYELKDSRKETIACRGEVTCS